MLVDPEEQNTTPVSVSELRELIDSQHRLLLRFEESGQLSSTELTLQRRLLVLATEELSRRTAQPRRNPMEMLWPAIASWSLVPEVPRSHRNSALGRVVTTTKRAFVAGVQKDVQTEFLNHQRAFNQALLDHLHPVVEVDDPKRRKTVAGMLRGSLDPLKNTPVQLGKTRSLFGRQSYLNLIGQWFEPALKRQRRWNHEVIEVAVATLSSGSISIARLHEMLGQLSEHSRLPAPAELQGVARTMFPLWYELFRKQQIFNESIVRTLAAVNDLPRPADDGRYSYPQALVTHESRRMVEVAREVNELRHRPLISLITPTYRTPIQALTSCLESVLGQSYNNWELCLLDDGSADPILRSVLEQYVRRDPRIRVRFNSKNGGIARATNDALNDATGDYVAFLDHDDALAPHALGEVALHLERFPGTDFLYTDEDRLDMSGRRVLPFFKPEWSPDLLRACNYVCHFLVVRRKLIEDVGRIREGFDGAQDYDLILRLSEKAKRVGHIAEVLYHWRASPQSTAMNVANKPQAATSGIRALSDHLRRLGENAQVVSPEPTQYQVRYELPNPVEVAVVVAAPNKPSPLLSSLGLTRYQNRKLVTIGGARGHDADSHLPWPGERDFGAMYEKAWRAVKAKVYVFVHDDVSIIDPEWLQELVGQALRAEIGVVGPKLVYPDWTIQDAGWVLNGAVAPLRPFEHMADVGEWTAMGSPNWTRNYQAVSSACFAVRAEVLDRLGGFQSGPKGVAPALDLCMRATAAGLRVLYTPHARLIHYARAARPDENFEGLVASNQQDPYFNPHLSPHHTNGTLRLSIPTKGAP